MRVICAVLALVAGSASARRAEQFLIDYPVEDPKSQRTWTIYALVAALLLLAAGLAFRMRPKQASH